MGGWVGSGSSVSTIKNGICVLNLSGSLALYFSAILVVPIRQLVDRLRQPFLSAGPQ